MSYLRWEALLFAFFALGKNALLFAFFALVKNALLFAFFALVKNAKQLLCLTSSLTGIKLFWSNVWGFFKLIKTEVRNTYYGPGIK